MRGKMFRLAIDLRRFFEGNFPHSLCSVPELNIAIWRGRIHLKNSSEHFQ